MDKEKRVEKPEQKLAEQILPSHFIVSEDDKNDDKK